MPTVASQLLRSKISVSPIHASSVKNESTPENVRRVTLHLVADADLPTFKNWVEFVQTRHGTLRPSQIFVASADGLELLLLVAKDYPRGLAETPPGTAHVSTYLGASVAAALANFSAVNVGLKSVSKEKINKVEIKLAISETLLEKISKDRGYFLLGLLQRSVKTKIVEGKEFSFTDENSVSLCVDSSFFSKADSSLAHDLSDCMLIARSLVNLPANILNPETYENFIHELIQHEFARSADRNKIQIEVFNSEKLLQDGCGLLFAVGKGSAVAPRLIKLSYEPKAMNGAPKHVVLVGKGITFDSGGLDIKGSTFMRNMKKDMGGSAAALGAFIAAVRAELPIQLTCYLALAENMVSGTAMRPGDIYKAKNGISVEIDNTDAEGRLVLADALCYAAEEKPQWIIDLGTLTGAARVALGPAVDALFSNCPRFQNLMVESGVKTGDWVWNLPLVADYEPWLESNVADMVNSASSGHGGAITAALFLKRFVGEIPWCHIDTYMWADKPTELTQEAGATGKCVRMVFEALKKYSQAETE